ncbi:hypothetical protein GCM10007198_27960 [Microbacterium aerolatum]|uniref:Cardiolipin synthase N-terminal domain-containing protein n=1 Tax=Microbacterium aerolatum TaxID=153731 RepID=A0A511AJT9_9MICO|nr:hypothetical protein MAE01_22570 [Microbacterium aerolatum]GGB35862.1 hypothetical protein GCM10007198_27960 [Microbacterium aerolatum]
MAAIERSQFDELTGQDERGRRSQKSHVPIQSVLVYAESMPFVSLLILALMIGALIDVITRDQSQVKHLPKMVWVILVVLIPLIGSILWFTLGREYGEGGVSLPRMPRRQARASAPRPAAAQWAPPADARTTEQQIADLDREIEEWRLREEIAKRKREDGAV